MYLDKIRELPIYQDFFSNSDLVISGHFGFNRFPVGSVNPDFLLHCRSRISEKCYIGIKTSQSLSFNKQINVYSRGHENFQNTSIEELYPKQETTILQILEKEFGVKNIEISILAEVGKGHGFGLTGSMISMVVTAVVLWKNQSRSIDKFENQIISVTHQIHQIISPHSVGNGFLATISDKPGVLFWEIPSRGENIYFGSIDDKLLLIDYAIVHSGKLQNSSRLAMTREFHHSKIDSITDYHNLIDHNTSHSYIDEILVHKSPKIVLQESISLLSIRTLQIINQITREPHIAEHVYELITHLNGLRGLTEILEGENKFAQIASYELSTLNKMPGNFSVFPLFTNKEGGDYLILTPINELSDHIDDFISRIGIHYPQAKLLDASRNSSIQPGITIDQRVSQGSYSNHVEEDTYLFIASDGRQVLGKYADISDSPCDILLNAKDNKVFHHNKELTSEYLKSKISTIDLFKALFASEKMSVSNYDLPSSSITRQQNQMLGKVIGPLKKYVREDVKKDLQLECHGSLRDFTVSIKPSECVIGLIISLTEWKRK